MEFCTIDLLHIGCRKNGPTRFSLLGTIKVKGTKRMTLFYVTVSEVAAQAS